MEEVKREGLLTLGRVPFASEDEVVFGGGGRRDAQSLEAVRAIGMATISDEGIFGFRPANGAVSSAGLFSHVAAAAPRVGLLLGLDHVDGELEVFV